MWWRGNKTGGMLGVDNELKNMEDMKNMIIEDTEFTNYICVQLYKQTQRLNVKRNNNVSWEICLALLCIG